MSAPSVSMHLVKEVLRLTAAGLSQRQIADYDSLAIGILTRTQTAERVPDTRAAYSDSGTAHFE